MAVREDDKSIIAYIRQIYPWARYAARNSEGTLTLHESAPRRKGGGMIQTSERRIELPREFLPEIAPMEIVEI